MAVLILLTLFSLSTIILSLAKHISIDCGASGSYVDSDNVTWLGDSGFVTTGQSFEIPGNIRQSANNLRYFPSGQTNCYTNIPATKRGKTLVRTTFYYGNYDNKSSPPSFIVDHDGKHLVPIVTGAKQFGLEVIYAPASENIRICLIRSPPSNDVPFISSIEVYSLDAGMYDDLGPDEVLILRQRFAFGAEEIIRWLDLADYAIKLVRQSLSGFNKKVMDFEGRKTRTNNAVGGRGRGKNKSPLIVGVTVACSFVVFVVAIFSRKCSQKESNTLPTTPGTVKGTSPLVGQQLASDASHPGPDEPGTYDIEMS